MAFRAGKTGVMQTAANVAATLVAAEVTAGLITSAEDADARFVSIRDREYAALETLVDADNVVFAEAEKSAPRSSGSNRSGGGSNRAGGGSTITAESAREMELTFGKFKGVTLGELEAMPASEAKDYGHGDGDKAGITYIQWLAKNENNAFAAKRAQAILDARKAESDVA